MGKQPTNQEILEAISTYSSNVDDKFKQIENDISIIKTDVACLKTDVSGLKTDVASLKIDVSGLKTDVAGLKTDVSSIKSTLNTQVVTKEYLDQKTAEIRGDFTIALRKEDGKLGVLTNKLGNRKVLSAADVQEVLLMEPFPQSL
ncbi:MAG: hypothetical protein V1664_05040 [Candidatus Uhrbacteria bacterium]